MADRPNEQEPAAKVPIDDPPAAPAGGDPKPDEVEVSPPLVRAIDAEQVTMTITSGTFNFTNAQVHTAAASSSEADPTTTSAERHAAVLSVGPPWWAKALALLGLLAFAVVLILLVADSRSGKHPPFDRPALAAISAALGAFCLALAGALLLLAQCRTVEVSGEVTEDKELAREAGSRLLANAGVAGGLLLASLSFILIAVVAAWPLTG